LKNHGAESREYVIAELGADRGMLVADETGFLNRGHQVGWGAAVVLRHRGPDRELPAGSVPGLRGAGR
jgi:hypothetical protein